MTTTNKNIITVDAIRAKIENEKARSAWARGVKEYAAELLDILAEGIEYGWINEGDLKSTSLLKKALLNGSDNWGEYSWGGCSLIYNTDIAERLCTSSELVKTLFGHKPPNSREEWLDTQARALRQAARLIMDAAHEIGKAASND